MTRPRTWILLGLLGFVFCGCRGPESAPAPPSASPGDSAPAAAAAVTSATVAALDLPTTETRLRIPEKSLAALADPQFRALRQRMIDNDISPARSFDGRDPVKDKRVVAAMRFVPRHEFVPPDRRPYSYLDSPLPIGSDQTISQPYIVALMTELLEPKPDHRVLEVGTGSGYQAAVLGILVKDVYTIEIVKPLAERAEQDLRRLGYDNVFVRHGDGYQGWPDKAPFDGIIVTAAPERIPQPLVDQLKEGGRMVLPVGPTFNQELVVLEKTKRGVTRRTVIPVRFVPMTGEIQKPEAK